MSDSERNFTYDELVALLHELDYQLDLIGYTDTFNIHAIGGFAMLAHGIRKSGLTGDIDTISPEFPAEVQQALKIVSKDNGINEHWLNNEPVLPSDYEEDPNNSIETINAMLDAHYEHLDLGLKHISVNIADINTLAYAKAQSVNNIIYKLKEKHIEDLHDIFEYEGIDTISQAKKRFPFLADQEYKDCLFVLKTFDNTANSSNKLETRNQHILDDALNLDDNLDYIEPLYKPSFSYDDFNWTNNTTPFEYY